MNDLLINKSDITDHVCVLFLNVIVIHCFQYIRVYMLMT